MDLALPCGGSCPVELYRISLCGVIPYMLSVGPIKGRCGDAVCLSTSGLVTVDLDLGYLCEAPGAQWKEIGCENITACTELILPESGCKTGRNLLVKGSFCFSGLSMGEAAAK